jgi:hypothetical protein
MKFVSELMCEVKVFLYSISQTTVFMEQSGGTYSSIGIAALYFADRICEAVLSEMLISENSSKAISHMNGKFEGCL